MEESPPFNAVLVRYGEIALKSRSVRARFERRLADNLLDQLEAGGVNARVERLRGRYLVYADPLEGAFGPVSRTFGVVSYSPVVRLDSSNPEEICELAAGLAVPRLVELGSGASFGVKARRSGNHDYSSMELAGRAGAAILAQSPDALVNLGAPDLRVELEVQQNVCYAMVETMPGVGGMPLGSQGRVAALIDSVEAVVAAWLLAKRGCTCHCLIAQAAVEQTEAALSAFGLWHPRLKITTLAGEGEKTVEELVGEAHRVKARALVLGWDLSRIKKLSGQTGLPLFMPLLGLEAGEIEGYRQTLLTGRPQITHPLAKPQGSGRRSRA